MTLSLATRLRRLLERFSLRDILAALLKRYTPLQLLDTLASIQQAEADECGQAGKDCRCYGPIREQAYCRSSYLHHVARCLRQCAGAIRYRDLERPAERSARK